MSDVRAIAGYAGRRFGRFEMDRRCNSFAVNQKYPLREAGSSWHCEPITAVHMKSSGQRDMAESATESATTDYADRVGFPNSRGSKRKKTVVQYSSQILISGTERELSSVTEALLQYEMKGSWTERCYPSQSSLSPGDRRGGCRLVKSSETARSAAES